MIVTVASYKGGVGKTTTAVHLAAFLQTQAPTLLLDGDDTRNATAWGKRGKGFPFKVADEGQAARLARNFTHTVIDTGQRPSQVDLKALSEGCDLLVIPAVPASLDTDGLVLTLQALAQVGAKRYRVLLVKAPPPPETEAAQLRADLSLVPSFDVGSPAAERELVSVPELVPLLRDYALFGEARERDPDARSGSSHSVPRPPTPPKEIRRSRGGRAA